jgi:guanylate kinase
MFAWIYIQYLIIIRHNSLCNIDIWIDGVSMNHRSIVQLYNTFSSSRGCVARYTGTTLVRRMLTESRMLLSGGRAVWDQRSFSGVAQYPVSPQFSKKWLCRRGSLLFVQQMHRDSRRSVHSLCAGAGHIVEQQQGQKKGLVLVISGPSGVGKDAVIRRLQEKRSDIHFVVTATSREMRPGEQDGVDYYFVSKEQFEEWIAEDRLLEHAVVYGEYKGIPRQQVEDALNSNTDVVLRIDVQGAATMRRLLPEMVSIFLVAESEEALVQRLVDRKTEPEDKMKVRIETAREEMSHVDEFDYVVVNRDGEMENTVTRIEDILLAEKMASRP